MAINDAVSAVLVHENKVFMIKRQVHLRAFPGYHAFPGGKVNRDESQTSFAQPLLQGFPASSMHALCRELWEELHFDLERSIAAGEVVDICELCTATTPDFNPYRFHTRFYKIVLARAPELKIDDSEIKHYWWKPAGELYELWRQGRLLVVPPMVRMLEELAADIQCRVVDDTDPSYDPKTEVPCIEVLYEIWMLPILSNTLLPATRTNAWIIGGFLVDPSPRSETELEKLFNVLQRFSLEGIFLTHHHADHFEYTQVLGRKLALPIHLSQDSHKRILQKKGLGFFDGITVVERIEGEVLTRWLDKEVMIYAVPGHDEGQLALAPESMEWFLVGDLIQGVGTVVIAAPEGNMHRYLATLKRVISLEPAIILPSHGPPMSGTHRLEETLTHRLMRENQVLELCRRGHDKQEMMEIIYKGLDPRLSRFAMASIDAHLAKLHEEGLIPDDIPARE